MTQVLITIFEQQENLHRRTSLFHCLENAYKMDPNRDWSYPLPEFGGAYSPKVPTFRASESKGYAFLPGVELVSYVAVAGWCWDVGGRLVAGWWQVGCDW